MPSAVNEVDLKHLYQLVEEKDGGPAWIHMMNRSTPTMTHQAWREILRLVYYVFFLIGYFNHVLLYLKVRATSVGFMLQTGPP